MRSMVSGTNLVYMNENGRVIQFCLFLNKEISRNWKGWIKQFPLLSSGAKSKHFSADTMSIRKDFILIEMEEIHSSC